MRYYIYTIIFTFIFCSFSWSGTYSRPQKNLQPTVRIAWDYNSIRQLAEQGGYPRLLRLADRSVAVVYETYTGDAALIKSYDEGITWSQPETIFSHFIYTGQNGDSTLVNISNPEIYQLTNGDIILACNYRPQKPEIAPYSIVIKRSSDNGKNWSVPQIIYNAAPRFTDGCWEPSFLQLPSGELQVYFANENPYQTSDEQEISLLRSFDNGATWDKNSTQVSFRKGRRDGMPVSRLINNEIVTIIEDNHIDRFRPYTVRTLLTDNWATPVLSDSPQRDYCLAEQITDSVYMGAPYLLQLPTGETVISYQTNENRSHNWEYSTLEVAIGNNQAKHYARRSSPFDIPLDKEGKWNSIALWDNNTVVALTSSDFRSAHVAPYLIKGYIIPDTILLNKTSKNTPDVFVGSKNNSSLRAWLTSQDDKLSIKSIIRNTTVHNNRPSQSTGIHVLIKNTDGQIIKLDCKPQGIIEPYIKTNNNWKHLNNRSIEAQHRLIDNESYELTITMDKKDISIDKINFVLSDIDSAGVLQSEPLINSSPDNPSTWLIVKY